MNLSVSNWLYIVSMIVSFELLKNGKKPEQLDKETSEAINLYKSLLIQLLSESEELAKELKLEPISKPLREAHRFKISKPNNG